MSICFSWEKILPSSLLHLSFTQWAQLRVLLEDPGSLSLRKCNQRQFSFLFRAVTALPVQGRQLGGQQAGPVRAPNSEGNCKGQRGQKLPEHWGLWAWITLPSFWFSLVRAISNCRDGIRTKLIAPHFSDGLPQWLRG